MAIVQKAENLPTKTDVLIKHKKEIAKLYGLNRLRISPQGSQLPIGNAIPSAAGSQGGTGNFLQTQGDTMIGPIAFFPVTVAIAGDDSIDIGQDSGSSNVPDYSTYVFVSGGPTNDLELIRGAGFSGQLAILQTTITEVITIEDFSSNAGGNIVTPDGNNIILDGTVSAQTITLIFDVTTSPNGNQGGWRVLFASSGLGSGSHIFPDADTGPAGVSGTTHGIFFDNQGAASPLIKYTIPGSAGAEHIFYVGAIDTPSAEALVIKASGNEIEFGAFINRHNYSNGANMQIDFKGSTLNFDRQSGGNSANLQMQFGTPDRLEFNVPSGTRFTVLSTVDLKNTSDLMELLADFDCNSKNLFDINTANHIVSGEITWDSSSAKIDQDSGDLRLSTGVGDDVILRPGGGTEYTFTSSAFDVQSNNIIDVANLTLNASGLLTLGDTTNIVMNATTGTKIGTGTSQKLAFWNTAPVTQRNIGTTLTNNASGGTTDTIASVGVGSDLVDASVINGNFNQLAADMILVQNAIKTMGIAAA